MSRFQSSDWLALGLRQLRNEGTAGLTIERLCEVAKRTRGSFYHHFEDRDSFIRELMEFWQKLQTDDVIEQVEAIDVARHRPQALSVMAANLDHRLENAVRRLGHTHAIAANYVRQVDDMRVDYLVKLYTEVAGDPESQALDLARLEYAAFVGAQVVWPTASREDLSQMDATFQRLVQGALGAT